MDEFLVKSNLILGKLLFGSIGTIDLFSTAHCSTSRNVYAATFFPPY
jgi:hypothetical protein